MIRRIEKISRQNLMKSLFLLNFSSSNVIRKLSLFKYFNSILPFISEIINFSSDSSTLIKKICIKKLKSDYKYFPLTNGKVYMVKISRKNA